MKTIFCTLMKYYCKTPKYNTGLDIKDLNIMANRIKLFRTDYLEQEYFLPLIDLIPFLLVLVVV